VPRTVKQKLTEQYLTLNPARLRRDMSALQQKLFKLVASKSRRYAHVNAAQQDTTYANIS
jgi:hypothetical protein